MKLIRSIICSLALFSIGVTLGMIWRPAGGLLAIGVLIWVDMSIAALRARK